MMTIHEIPTPSYVIDEKKLKENLIILKDVQDRAGCRILLAQKAFSAFALYPLIGGYLAGTCASGIYEAKLGREEMGKETHVFSPAYTKDEMQDLLQICDHIIFNSLSQLSVHRSAWETYHKENKKAPKLGLRINPQYSTQEHGIYDPCAPFSRLGITEEMLGEWAADLKKSPDEKIANVFERELSCISGLHFHTLCEQPEEDLERTFKAFEERFKELLLLPQITWVNLGGGHHITRDTYNREALVRLCKRIRETYGVEVYLEPGEAVALDAGYLATTVMDVVRNGMPVLILDASAACHMPDVLEMPYTPPLRGARAAASAGEMNGPAAENAENPAKLPENEAEMTDQGILCRLSSRTCLAGDVIGDYLFERMPRTGDRLYFEDMAIYSMVKNNTFNGMPLPSIYLQKENGACVKIKSFSYRDFKERLS